MTTDLDDIERWLGQRQEHREPAQATLILDRLPELLVELRAARERIVELELEAQWCVCGDKLTDEEKRLRCERCRFGAEVTGGRTEGEP